ncbi:hypothetical protein RBU49_06230 [Clostridium sp. MB40-C1]|uniref:hypothetical protein n=1 Tax=Clostridium sp. MB40-C1 TaxID=3070996 RepID=UPI0027E12961|nr:hypothetical protein [Clostridium sp. MB40-C1]WMJ81841.1 hypothetical protein RBU49_06230 [Clostridium sp. MB40-C1]
MMNPKNFTLIQLILVTNVMITVYKFFTVIVVTNNITQDELLQLTVLSEKGLEHPLGEGIVK